MLIDIITGLIGLIAISVIIIIIIRKFPVLSVIDIKKVPQEKENQVKEQLIEQKLKRKASNLFQKVSKYSRPVYKKLENQARNWRQNIIELEKRYQRRSKTPTTLEEKSEQERKISSLLSEAGALKDRELFKEAEGKCVEVLSLDAKNLDAYHYLGDLYLEMKDFEHAKEIFRFLIKLNASDDQALSGLGLVASSLGNLKEAEEELLASITYNNKKPSYYLDLARVYQALGQTDKALHCCQEALKLEPKNPKILHNLLQVCLEMKNKGLAIRTFDRLQAVNPENKKLEEIKKQIDSL
ncbi:MAG: tetratricopeptide repeat protein [Patescibacteria group bacterium]